MCLKAWSRLGWLRRSWDDVVGLAFLLLPWRQCGGRQEQDTTLWFLSSFLIVRARAREGYQILKIRPATPRKTNICYNKMHFLKKLAPQACNNLSRGATHFWFVVCVLDIWRGNLLRNIYPKVPLQQPATPLPNSVQSVQTWAQL